MPATVATEPTAAAIPSRAAVAGQAVCMAILAGAGWTMDAGAAALDSVQ
jgi:hypothetical protein